MVDGGELTRTCTSVHARSDGGLTEIYEHATPAFVPLVEAGRVGGPDVEAIVAESLAPLLGTRDEAGEFVFPMPASARIDTLLLGCTHYPLLRSVIAAVAGERVAIVDSATATASALVELLAINGLEAPGTSLGGSAAPAGAGRDEGLDRTADAPVHIQLTTGDIDAFRVVAERIFGEAFPDVASVEVSAVPT